MQRLVAAFILAFAPAVLAQPVSQQITETDTALLFGGGDAEGGIGDWYVSNGVVEAIIDDAGRTPDLVGVVAPGTEPRMGTGTAPSGGNLVDVGLVGADNDQLSQMFSVGGLSTENFVVFDEVTAPSPGVLRATGALMFPPISTEANPCLATTSEYRAEGTDPFLTIATTTTNGCGEVVGLGGYLDAFIWTIRSLIPFSGGAGGGGVGFDHFAFNIAAPVLETPTFLAAPGNIGPTDGVVDPANGTASGEVSYGLLGVDVVVDQDGPGGADPFVTEVNSFFGISSTLVTALGNVPTGSLDAGGTITYTRRLYVGGRNDVRAVSNDMLTDLAPRTGLALGTISGDVDAADDPDVRASILVTRLGRCTDDRTCHANDDCGAAIPCADPTPTTGFGPGGAVTHIRTDDDGTFSGVVLPNGDYELVISAPGRDDLTVAPVTVLDADTALATQTMSARGTLAFRIREKRKGKPLLPAKLVVHGVDSTPDPRFAKDLSATLSGGDLIPESFGGTERGPSGDARGQGNVIYTTTGEGSIELRPGTYTVWATRGMEYGIRSAQVVITAGQTTDVDFLLKRVIKSKNAISADFHIHSVRSFDASTPLEDRVASFVSEGVEVMVSTEHDKHADYGPIVDGLGLGNHVATIAGVEITGAIPNPPVFPNSIGHINAWPMPVDADVRRDGAVHDEYVAPNWVYSRFVDAGGPDVVIQYNHVRAGVAGLTSIGFFNSIGCGRCANAIDTTCAEATDCPAGPGRSCTCVGYQPDRPIDMPPNDLLLDNGILGPGTAPNPTHNNLDFHVMEIANGARVADAFSLVQVRADWFSLLRQDIRRWATGVSDSHRATVEHAGWGRTYVLGVGDDPATVDLDAFNDRVRAGAMVLSSGPYIELLAKAGKAKAGIGEELAATKGKVKLKIRVTSPAWVPVDEVRILVNGEVVEIFDATTKPKVKPIPSNVEANGKTTRLKTRRTLTLEQDAFVVVEAGIALPEPGGPVPESPPSMDAIVADVVPYALTNPIFIDVGGDGYQAPGLPAAAGSTGRMTGVTDAQRAEAMHSGEYLPIWKLDLSSAVR